MNELTKGAIEMIIKGIDVEAPVLQILNSRKPKDNDLYKLIISDGEQTYFNARLSLSLNTLITENIIQSNSICQITKYAKIRIAGEQSIIILNMDIKVPGNLVSKSPSTSGGGCVTKVPDTQVPMPIADVNPSKKNIVIEARVNVKYPIKTWSGANGSGKMFCLDLEDDSGQIRCTAFNNECDKFFNAIDSDSTYYFSKLSVKTAKQYTLNKYELVLLRYSEVSKVEKPLSLTYNFISLIDVCEKKQGDVVDVLGIIYARKDVCRTSGGKNVIDIMLMDKDNILISLSLWDSHAISFCGKRDQILAAKDLRVRKCNMESVLSSTRCTILEINPHMPEAYHLQAHLNMTRIPKISAIHL